MATTTLYCLITEAPECEHLTKRHCMTAFQYFVFVYDKLTVTFDIPFLYYKLLLLLLLKQLRKNGEANVPSGRPTQNYCAPKQN